MDESFTNKASRRAFFAKLRENMQKYPRGKYNASEYLYNTPGGLKHAGYEENGKVKNVEKVQGFFSVNQSREKLLKRLRKIRNVKGAPTE